MGQRLPDSQLHVMMPWRPTRSRAYAQVVTETWYRDTFAPDTFNVIDTPSEPFSLAAARNAAVDALLDGGASPSDVVVLADADTLPELIHLDHACRLAARSGRIHLPYREYRSLGERGTDEYLDGKPLEDCDHIVVDGAVSGVLVATMRTWLNLGGQDSRFLGWGYEDVAFHHVHRVMLGETFRRPPLGAGRVYSLHHADAMDKGTSWTVANLELCKAYLRCTRPDEVEAVRSASDA